MTLWAGLLEAVMKIIGLGGPVVAVLALVSIITTGVILYKIWQYHAAGVGRHRALQGFLKAYNAHDMRDARRFLEASRSYLVPVLQMAIEHKSTCDIRARLDAEAESHFAALERGLRLLESVTQLAPLLGLFGTVLGMIEAFQSLQAAGSQVDPSLLAGGIWVALLTTAVGLGVAMPTSVVLSWLEGRIAADRVLADQCVATILTPTGATRAKAQAEELQAYGT